MFAGKYALKNGKIIPVRDFFVEPNDLGFLRGFGVFDVMETRDDIIFHEKDHFERIFKGLKDIRIDIKVEYIKKFPFFLKKLLKKNKLRHSYLRIDITGGLTKDGFNPCGFPQCYAFYFKHKHKSAPDKGLKISTLNFNRSYPLIKKSGDYFGAEIFLKKRKKIDDVLYVGKNNKILETSRRNIFIIDKKNIIKTPKEDILPGITRMTILKLFPEIKQTDVSLKDLFSAKEIFTSATVSGILPVVQINNKKFPVGNITEKVRNAFLKYKESYFKNKLT